MVARGGAASLYTGDADVLTKNPSLGFFMNQIKTASFALTFAFLPDDISYQQVSLFMRVDKTAFLYFYINQLTSDFKMTSTSLEDLGELNNRSVSAGLTTGGKMPLFSFPLAWGLGAKFYSLKSYVYDRNALALDGGITADFNKINTKAFVVVKNAGLDLLQIKSLLDPTNVQNGLIVSNRYAAPLPTSLAFGAQYQLLNYVVFRGELEYFFPDPSVYQSAGASGQKPTVFDGELRPKLNLDLILIKSFTGSIGWYFRGDTGMNYFNFGIEWDIKIFELGVTMRYAISTPPNLPPSHYLGLAARIE
jgi:hypothetical protein